MNFTAETLAIAIAFILPGFLANRLADYYSTSDARQDSGFEATLSSLAIGAGILFLQAILASIALAILWFGFRSTFDQLELNTLVDDGLEAHFRAQPLLVAATVGAAALVSVTIGFLIGYYDVIRTLLKPRLTNLGLAGENTWYVALKSARQEAGKKYTYVEVTMTKDGEVLRGVMKAFDFRTREDGSRDLILQSVKRKAGKSPEMEWSSDPMPGLTLLNSRDFENLRIVFSDLRTPEGEDAV